MMDRPSILRPGASDLVCALLLVIGSAVAVKLEPAYREFWLALPLSVAATLLVTAALAFARSRVASAIAAVIHLLLFVSFAIGALLSLLLLITILFFGTGLVLLPPCLVLAGNSAFTLFRIVATGRQASSQSPA